MNAVVEKCDSKTGWTGSSAKVSAYAVNQIPEYIAGLNTGSLVVKFDSGSKNEYIRKAVSFDPSGYFEMVFHFWSRNKKRKGETYQNKADFAYKVNFGGADYFIPTYDTFSDVTLHIAGHAAMTKIEITCLHDDEDYVIVSNFVAVTDELPRDIYQAVKEQLNADLSVLYGRIRNGVAGKGIQIGTVTGSAGEKSVMFSQSVNWLDKYAVVKIDDNTNNEIHQIDHNDELEFYFNSMYDGSALKHDYSSAPVYLVVPVEYGLTEREIILPGIALQGMNPEENFNVNKIENVPDTFKGDETVRTRRADPIFRYMILIDCEARHYELIALMSQIVRYFLAREVLWVNGKKIEIRTEGPSTFIEPTEGYNEIPKIQYIMRIEVKENAWDRETLVKTLVNHRSFDVVEQGEIPNG